MSRIYESDDCYEEYPNQYALQEQAFYNAINGRKGQALLKEMEAALLALPEKKLIGSAFCKAGQVCILGAVALHREISKGRTRDEALLALEKLADEKGGNESDEFDYNDGIQVAFAKKLLGIAETVAWRMISRNDGYSYKTDEDRYQKILAWVQENIKKEAAK